MHLKEDHSAVQDDHSSKHNEECRTHINDTNDSEDKSHDESDRPPHLSSMESNKIVDQGCNILLPMGPGRSSSISMRYNLTTITSTFPQDIPSHLYKGISIIVHLILPLLVSLRNGVLSSSLLLSLQSTSVLESPLTPLWNIFLRRLYKDISTIIYIQVKLETHSYDHLYEDVSTVTPKHTKLEITRSWVLSHSSLQTYMKYFHKLITNYMIDCNYSNNNGNIRR